MPKPMIHYTVNRHYPEPGTGHHRRVVAAQWLFWLNTCECNGGVVRTRRDVTVHPEWLDPETLEEIRGYVLRVK